MDFLPLVLPNGKTQYEQHRARFESLIDEVNRINALHKVDRDAAANELIAFNANGVVVDLKTEPPLYDMIADHRAFEAALFIIAGRRRWVGGETLWLDSERFIHNDGGCLSLNRTTPDKLYRKVHQLGKDKLAFCTAGGLMNYLTAGWKVAPMFRARARRVVAREFTDAGAGL